MRGWLRAMPISLGVCIKGFTTTKTEIMTFFVDNTKDHRLNVSEHGSWFLQPSSLPPSSSLLLLDLSSVPPVLLVLFAPESLSSAVDGGA
eukprot:m.367892 g.367892  ORF g.367892 m.367892 type:complete len:90 (-) comp20838_c0_seq15:572-841(-)